MNKPLEATVQSFPTIRLRRNRKTSWSRALIAENSLQTSDLILPIFVKEDDSIASEIKSMPDVKRLNIKQVVEKAVEAEQLGIPAIALFPVIDAKLKDETGSEAYNKSNLIARAIEAIKAKARNIGVICDVALDPYTSHGHDGIIKNGDVDNDLTVAALAKQAVQLAQSGADIVAPSDMMDGRVLEIRKALDKAVFTEVQILAYSAKYCSNFYGPFRDAVASKTNLGEGNKKTYQMDFANSDEALREVALDINEGADMVMVKPGMPYLDIIRRIKDNFNIPIIAYQVSGEYAMLQFAAKAGALDYNEALLESLIAFKRAGCSAVLTYAAIEAAKLINAVKEGAR